MSGTLSEAFVWPELRSRPANPVAAEQELRQRAMEEGHAAGFERGLEEGREAARAELATMRQQLSEGLATLEQSLAACRAERFDALAATVHALCCKVLGWELTSSVEVLEEIVAGALSRLDAEDAAVEVCLHPDDHAVVVASYHGELKLHADPQVPSGGVSVRLPTQSADYDPAELIDELFETVRNATVD